MNQDTAGDTGQLSGQLSRTPAISLPPRTKIHCMTGDFQSVYLHWLTCRALEYQLCSN